MFLLTQRIASRSELSCPREELGKTVSNEFRRSDGILERLLFSQEVVGRLLFELLSGLPLDIGLGKVPGEISLANRGLELLHQLSLRRRVIGRTCPARVAAGLAPFASPLPALCVGASVSAAPTATDGGGLMTVEEML